MFRSADTDRIFKTGVDATTVLGWVDSADIAEAVVNLLCAAVPTTTYQHLALVR